MLLVNTEDKFLQRCFGMHISSHGGNEMGKRDGWRETRSGSHTIPLATADS